MNIHHQYLIIEDNNLHSNQMHVIQHFEREGDALLCDVTVEDPEVLAEPYVYPQ